MNTVSCLMHWLFWQASFCSFMPTHIGAETDLRFVYCAGEEHCPLFTFYISIILYFDFFIDLISIWCVFAAAICSMLDDWTGMDKLKAKEYILNCQVDFRKLRMRHILHWDTYSCNAYCLILVVIICSHMMEALVWFLVLNLMVSNFIWPFYLLLYIFIIFIWRT